MPPLGNKRPATTDEPVDDPVPEPDLDLCAEAWEVFQCGFRRSKKGNLWRNFEGDMTLTIFRRRGDDTYGWCVADEQGPRFSRRGFETEEAALFALAEALGVLD
jgi:hypothetical protein